MPNSLIHELQRRVQVFRQEMARVGADTAIFVPGTNFTYLSGMHAHVSERLVAFVVRPDRILLIHPAFEGSRLAAAPGYALCDQAIPWEETEDPYRMAAGAIGDSRVILADPVLPFWQFERFRRSLPGAEWQSAAPLIEPLRMRKSPWELDCIRQACAITKRAMDALFKRLEGAHGTVDAEQERIRLFSDFAAEGSIASEGLLQFDAGSADPHGQAEGRMESPYVALLDCGANIQGYWADLTRTRCLRPSAAPRFDEIHSIVRKAHDAAIAAIRPGVTASSIDRAAREVIEAAGFGRYFTHRVGHGLGLDIHEPPYLSGDNELLLEPGMVVTIEPGIYLPGEFGIRLENDIVVTESGAKSLSDRE